LTTPNWLDPNLYLFEQKALEVPAGTMRYVDEGTGHPILMLHGTPTWSFLYRDFIRDLSTDYRVIAPDYIGSGLSDKPSIDAFGYTPKDHAANVAALIDALKLENFTLAIHDFGGPIGLPYALDNPGNVRRLVVMNTWMWPLSGGTFAISALLLGGPIGRFLYERTDFEFKVIVPSVYADKSKLTPQIEAHYRGPFDGTIGWTYARALGASRDWYAGLWEKRAAIADHPALLLWGMKDSIFGPGLARFQEVFTNPTVVKLDDAGHFVQEEAPQAAIAHMRQFLADT
jgi:haloalkane dehalogenase